MPKTANHRVTGRRLPGKDLTASSATLRPRNVSLTCWR
jgi:hypothetical protein